MPVTNIELQHVVDLAAIPVAGLTSASDAERAADAEHQRIHHDGRDTALRKRRLGYVHPMLRLLVRRQYRGR